MANQNNIIKSTQKVSPYLKGFKRLETESFEDYKLRLQLERQMTKLYLRGQFHGADILK